MRTWGREGWSDLCRVTKGVCGGAGIEPGSPTAYLALELQIQPSSAFPPSVSEQCGKELYLLTLLQEASFPVYLNWHQIYVLSSVLFFPLSLQALFWGFCCMSKKICHTVPCSWQSQKNFEHTFLDCAGLTNLIVPGLGQQNYSSKLE